MKALLIVDVQNDFCPGGALGVPEGDTVVPVVNRCLRYFSAKGWPVFLSRDWHPRKTVHFARFGGVWPVHCIRETSGAAFHPGLRIPSRRIELYKGMDPAKDSYSVFQASDADGIPFPVLLKIFEVKELYLGGLATDYCIKFTALDAVAAGLKVRVLRDAVKGVDLKPGDSLKAIVRMRAQGVQMISSARMIGR